MNRRKKSIQIVKGRIKKAKAKLSTKTKSRYISKADRLKLEEEAPQDESIASESSS